MRPSYNNMPKYHRILWLPFICGLASCSEEASVPAALGEVCEVDGPFRMVGPTPGQLSFGVAVAADRLFYNQGSWPLAEGEKFAPELWSVGACGESPRRLGGDITQIFFDERWPDLLLGCREQTRDIVIVDPASAGPPHVVFADTDCGAYATPRGRLTRSGELDGPGGLVLHPYPEDPRSETSSPIELLGLDTPISPGNGVVVRGDEVFFIGDDTALMRLDLPDGALTVEQTNVYTFNVSADGRYLLWQDTAVTGDSFGVEGAVSLRDRSTGDGMLLAKTSMAGSTLLGPDEGGLVALRFPYAGLQLYFLPGLAPARLPDGFDLHARLPDGRWLLRYILGGLYIADLHDPKTLTPFFGDATIVRVEADGVILLEMPPLGLGSSEKYAEAALWFVPLDGRPARMLAERASYATRLLDDGRILTGVDLDEQGIGTLVLVDPDTRSEQIVDTQVMSGYAWSFPPLGDDVLRYQVDDGERSGIWLARLPPAE